MIAGLANLCVTLIKVVAGVVTGSSAMLAEAAHSAADTLNQGFLLASLKRSQKPADAEHPFGYGQERYFWSLLAAFGIFVAGAGFSIFEGILALTRPEGSRDALVAYAVLAVGGVAECTSFVRAYRQVRGDAATRQTSVAEHVRTSPDTTVKTTTLSSHGHERAATQTGAAYPGKRCCPSFEIFEITMRRPASD